MPDIQLIKLSIRRGTDAQRKLVVLEQGEFGFTTDHKRLWVGDGVLSGGNIIGAKIHTPITSGKTSLTTAVQGDVVYENSLLYQLTGVDYSVSSSWGDIGEKPDNIYIQRDASNKFTLVNNSIDGNKFATTAAATGGGLVATTTSGLSVVPDYSTLEVASGVVRIKNSGVTESEIASAALNKGLKGGGGTVIELDVDDSLFGFVGTTLTLSALPTQSVIFDTLDPSWVGSGLFYDTDTNTITANLSGVNATLSNTSGVVGLATIGAGTITNWPEITIDQYGRVVNLTSSLHTSLTCNNTTSQILSTFNGHPDQVLTGNPGITLTTFTGISSNGTQFENITLSSAGFIVVPGASTQDGKNVGRIAIPVFTL